MSQKTEWFPGNLKPVHEGVYETKREGYAQVYQNWDGQFWGYFCATPDRAAAPLNATQISRSQNHEWRGLTEPADAAQ